MCNGKQGLLNYVPFRKRKIIINFNVLFPIIDMFHKYITCVYGIENKVHITYKLGSYNLRIIIF